MRIAVIGGIDRSANELVRMAKNAGFRMETHTGRTKGRGAEEIRAVVKRSDMVVIVTNVNSHGGMGVAKDAAQKLNRDWVIMRTCGPSKFQEVLDSLAQKNGPQSKKRGQREE
jgi:hypothetical protein